jgi:hypothetical protein
MNEIDIIKEYVFNMLNRYARRLFGRIPPTQSYGWQDMPPEWTVHIHDWAYVKVTIDKHDISCKICVDYDEEIKHYRENKKGRREVWWVDTQNKTKCIARLECSAADPNSKRQMQEFFERELRAFKRQLGTVSPANMPGEVLQ